MDLLNFLFANRSKIPHEHVITKTYTDQIEVEALIEACFINYKHRSENDDSAPHLHRNKHIQYLLKELEGLSSQFEILDCSRPWLCYWICHSLTMLEYELDLSMKNRIVSFLSTCQSPTGGFGGGPGQSAHLASTYAAVNALCCVGTEDALNMINRATLREFLWKMRCGDTGAFALEEGGEVDIRGTYCAAAVAAITNIHLGSLFRETPNWIARCQTYEGGFAGCPGMEAHGGYTFCGLATLVILSMTELCNVKALLRWCVNKQTSFEGGFQGRTNKLVDACYSYWVGATFSMIYAILNNQKGQMKVCNHLFNNRALQEYILICCQHPSGGIVDKPDKPKDAYHTCYGLSGLSIAQYKPNRKRDAIGSQKNLLVTIHPVFNLEENRLRSALKHFSMKPEIL